MSIMNSKERKARNRGREQGYSKCVDDFIERLLYEFSDEYIQETVREIAIELKEKGFS